MESDKIKPRTCLVTGASGVLGAPLVSELVAKGHAVRVLLRPNSKGANKTIFPETVNVIRGDLSDDGTLEKAIKGVDWIFHLAAKLHINDPVDEELREYREINVHGTAKLLRLAGANAVEKFIFFSTINVYGTSEDAQFFDESSELHPTGIYAETKAEAEKLVLSCRTSSNEQIGIVLRLAAVYGCRMKGNYLRLLDALKKKRFLFIGQGANRRTLVHQTDAVKAAALAAEKAPAGSVYNVTDGEIHTLKEIIDAMCRSLRISSPRIKLPLGPVKAIVGTTDHVGELLGAKLPISRKLLEKYLEDIAVKGEKIQMELGFRPEYDLVSGWNETIAELHSLNDTNSSK